MHVHEYNDLNYMFVDQMVSYGVAEPKVESDIHIKLGINGTEARVLRVTFMQDEPSDDVILTNLAIEACFPGRFRNIKD